MLKLACFSRRTQSSVFIALLFAKEVLHIFEDEYPSDMRPREAIEAAEAWLNDRTEVNCKAAHDASYAADAAHDAANAAQAADAAYAASYAAYIIDRNSTADGIIYAAYAADVVNKFEYFHQIFLKNISSILDFHIKEGIAFGRPEVVFQYLNDEQKERFMYNINFLIYKEVSN